jgi:asparagine synthase (glutamine-hydrolysing)
MVVRPGREPEIRRYWDLDFSGTPAGTTTPDAELVEQLRGLLRQGVERRLMADVPIGFFLSGGIDSSLSTALAAELSRGPIQTFTLTYAQDSTTAGKEEDRRWARWVAERYGTEHYEETVTFSRFPESLRRILTCFDEPFAGVVSTYYLAELIGRHVKVALSGDGADELFGSYLSHRLAFPLANYSAYVKTGDPDLIRPFEAPPEFLARFAGRNDWAWRHDLCVFTDDEKRALYAPDLAVATKDFSTGEHLRRSFASLTAADPLNRILEFEFRTFFPDQVLTFVDRLSMAHSLEVRSAFLDTDVVTFVAGLSGRLKIKNGETKSILKQVARKYFPDEMVFRKKEGFVMPVADWLLSELRDYVYQTLSAERLGKHGFFEARRVQDLVDGFYRGGPSHTYANKVLSLVVFQEWYELYMM